MRQLDAIEDQTLVKSLHKKMAPPLVTLLSAESEIQYVALRNINLIVQKSPQTLAHEVKVSRCPNKIGVCQHKIDKNGLGQRDSYVVLQGILCSCGEWKPLTQSTSPRFNCQVCLCRQQSCLVMAPCPLLAAVFVP